MVVISLYIKQITSLRAIRDVILNQTFDGNHVFVASYFYIYYTIFLNIVNSFWQIDNDELSFIMFEGQTSVKSIPHRSRNVPRFKAINAFVVIPCSSNIFSCSVSMLPFHIGSLCRLYVFETILNPSCSKYFMLALNKFSSSVLKYISPSGFKKVLYFCSCFVCVNLFLLCLGFCHGLQKFIYILSIVSFSFNMFCIISIS